MTPPSLADDLKDLPKLLTPEQVAELLQLKVETVRSMKYRGELPGVVTWTAKGFRVRKSALLAWLRQKQGPSTPGV